MLARIARRIATLALALAGVAASASGQESVRLGVRPESRLWIEGSSNLHDWSCRTDAVDAAIDVDAAWFDATGDVSKLLQRVQVRVPVSSLRCANRVMDRQLYQALRADASPLNRFIEASFDVVPGAAAAGVRTAGTLVVAGRANAVALEVTATRRADGTVRAEGAVPILMTDYGVDPPRAMFGALRTRDRVLVKFELLVGSPAAPGLVAAAGQH